MAQANAGAVMVQEPTDVPAAPAANGTAHGQSAANTTSRSNADATPAAADDTDDDDDEWDSESLYNDILAQQDDIEYSTDTAHVCAPDEARQIRQRLHDVGVNKFVFEYITSERYSARKMCTAFNLRLPRAMDDLPDKFFYRLLGMAISAELNMRRRLKQYATIDDAAKLLQERSNVMVITGAGISTSLGIPDFRSKNTGFYSKLRAMGIEEPEEVFSIQNFDDDPTTFYKLAGEIVPDLKKWSPTHEFIRLLQDKEKLLTNYTQNIDNVESHAGIRREKLIQCHGSWAMATCRKCKHQVPGEDIYPAVKEGIPAQCKQCVHDMATRKPGMKRKRSSNGAKKRRQAGDDDSDSDGAYDLPQPGIMKPDITFFGEALPEDFYERLKYHDRDKVDLVIVIGTSMKVAPVSEIPQFVPKDVPQIYISRDPITHINFDINLLGDCDVVVAELARRAGWTLNHKMIPPNQEVDVFAVDEPEHIYRVKAREKAFKKEASAA